MTTHLAREALEYTYRMRIEQQVNICSIYGFLDWSGDNWPQPHRVLGISTPWNWDQILGWEVHH